MSTHRNIDAICVMVLIFTILLTILFINGRSLGIEEIIDEDAEIHSDSVNFTANDLDGEWSTDGATVITLNGDNRTPLQSATLTASTEDGLTIYVYQVFLYQRFLDRLNICR